MVKLKLWKSCEKAFIFWKNRSVRTGRVSFYDECKINKEQKRMAGDLHEMSRQACLTKHSSLNVFFLKRTRLKPIKVVSKIVYT